MAIHWREWRLIAGNKYLIMMAGNSLYMEIDVPVIILFGTKYCRIPARSPTFCPAKVRQEKIIIIIAGKKNKWLRVFYSRFSCKCKCVSSSYSGNHFKISIPWMPYLPLVISATMTSLLELSATKWPKNARSFQLPISTLGPYAGSECISNSKYTSTYHR